jgi:hypothetical protein
MACGSRDQFFDRVRYPPQPIKPARQAISHPFVKPSSRISWIQCWPELPRDTSHLVAHLVGHEKIHVKRPQFLLKSLLAGSSPHSHDLQVNESQCDLVLLCGSMQLKPNSSRGYVNLLIERRATLASISRRFRRCHVYPSRKESPQRR